MPLRVCQVLKYLNLGLRHVTYLPLPEVERPRATLYHARNVYRLAPPRVRSGYLVLVMRTLYPLRYEALFSATNVAKRD